jgi:hypothetical protein
MRVYNKSVTIPKEQELSFGFLASLYEDHDDFPIRFVVTGSDDNHRFLEIDCVDFEGYEGWPIDQRSSIFEFRRRSRENTERFNAALIIPTGIGCELGGHEGDANAVARLIASVCDTLVTHPNVVNATDYNEMSKNTLYVEGSTLTRLLMGQIGLQEVRANRILTLVDKGSSRYNNEIRNSVSTARITLGIDSDIHEMEELTSCKIELSESGRAVGVLDHMENLFETVDRHIHDYDAVALSTHLDRDTDWYHEYFDPAEGIRGVVVNPTGGIEAMITHCLVEYLGKPSAHAPAPQDETQYNATFDPRLSPFPGSIRHIHCVLKGLHKSPRIVDYEMGINAEDISCMLIPDGCIGLPVLACIEQQIPVIAVKNRSIMNNNLDDLPFRHGKFFRAANYLEAVGIMRMIKEGITFDTVTRPIGYTKLL